MVMLDYAAFGVCLLIAILIVWVIPKGQKVPERVRPAREPDYDLASGCWTHPRAHERVTPQAGRRVA